MYKLEPYNLSENFKYLQKSEKYQLTLWHENKITFGNKRDAFTFISKISNFFIETLQFCELVQFQSNLFESQLRPASKSVNDNYNVYFRNVAEIHEIIRDLKYFRNTKKELYQLVMLYINLLNKILENIKILKSQLSTQVNHLFILFTSVYKSFYHVLSNVEANYRDNKISLFNI